MAYITLYETDDLIVSVVGEDNNVHTLTPLRIVLNSERINRLEEKFRLLCKMIHETEIKKWK